jgi:hypothetical protein
VKSATHPVDQRMAHIKRAELASGVGAGVLGGGLGLLLAPYLGSYAIIILVLGAFLHGWGMLDKHRMDAEAASSSIWWSDLLYWVCWVALLLLAIYIVVDLI